MFRAILEEISFYIFKDFFVILDAKDKWLSLAEICSYLSISKDTVYRLIKKDFPAPKVGNRWKARCVDIDNWIAANNLPHPIASPKKIFDKTTSPLRIASLFSGCGGLDLGFLGNFTSNKISYSQNPVDESIVQIQNKIRVIPMSCSLSQTVPLNFLAEDYRRILDIELFRCVYFV
jgi:excisionase family DNA binding protein